MALADYNMGSTGGGVSDLQAALNDVGAGIDVDGVFGPETQSAVMRFQQARGFRPDGIAGPGTLIELSVARGEGWTMPPVTAPVPPGPIARPATPGAVAPAGGPDTKMLFMLVGAGLLIWWWQSQKRGSPFSGRSRPHPTDVVAEDEEEEEEEEESEGGEDEEDDDEEEGEDVD